MKRMTGRRTIIILAVAIILLVLVSYIALGRMNLSSNFSGRSNPENGPVTIRAETDKSSYALGEIVRFKVFLVNKGPETLTIGPVDYGYTVYDSEGNALIRLIVSGLHPYGTAFTLAPNGDVLLTDLLEWGQVFVRHEGDKSIIETVSPGTYTIQVETRGSIEATTEFSVTIGGK